MIKRIVPVLLLLLVLAVVVILYLGRADAVKTVPEKPADVNKCYECHSDIKDFHRKGKHAKVNCAACHEGLAKHLEDADAKPVTKTGHEVCGSCHKDQYQSLIAVNYRSSARLEKATFRGRSPLFDKLIMPYGFTKEHNSPRSHVFMLADHLTVDRAYGGRFQLKDWTKIDDAQSIDQNVWEVLVDKEPGTSEQKAFMPQVFTSANPVCLNCKTQDHILKWKYMGDPDPKAKWSRTSKVVEFARDLQHAINCYMCHDPHSTQPRVVRDALINAVVDRNEGTYPYDKEKSKKITMTKVTFRDFRAIGLLNKPDSNVLCAQCHVEYVCNPGYDPKTGEPITMADRRTNYFPWTNVLDLKKRYEQVNFKDFKHAVTGAYLTKLQHPDAETQWGSVHEKNGVECKDCHMFKAKNKAGKVFTWHGQKSPRNMLKETCIRCHPYWNEEQAAYQIDAVKNYIRGKMAKSEFWLARFIDKYYEAKMAGVPAGILKQAQEYHDTAHIYWEWWTAENSDGFHNPAMARESLTRSVDASQAGINLLDKALADLKGGK